MKNGDDEKKTPVVLFVKAEGCVKPLFCFLENLSILFLVHLYDHQKNFTGIW